MSRVDVDFTRSREGTLKELAVTAISQIVQVVMGKTMQDATAVLNEIVGALDGLANHALSQIGEDRTFMEMWGWNCPAINRHDFAAMIREPIEVIRTLKDKMVEDEDLPRLQTAPTEIAYILANAMPQLPGGNAFQVYITVSSFLEKLSKILSRYANPTIDWVEIEDKKLLPAAQVRRLKQLDASMNRIGPDFDSLSAKISLINDAHTVAESLPTDLETLKEARKEFADATRIVEENKTKSGEAKAAAENSVAEIALLKADAEKLVRNTEAAYSAATTQGLGKAFGDKATALSRTTWWLGAALAVTLGVGGYISSQRIEFIHTLMLKPNVSLQLLWVNVTLTIISVAAPIWFAWILTKQIGQRFRLSEDYAFKASVAKAYEGYRREAASVDQEFVKRLYSLALDRLEEAPLRHVEAENHGSPWHELFSKRNTKVDKLAAPAAEAG